jgi:hypothetical protein
MKIEEPRDGRLHEAHSLADCVSNAAAATVLTVSVLRRPFSAERFSKLESAL